MFITVLSLKDNTFNKTNESNSDGFHDSISMEKKEKKIVNRVYGLFLTIIKEKESIDNNNNE